MVQATVYEIQSQVVAGQATKWTGDAALGRMLQKKGWILGADIGFGRNNEGEGILRAQCDTHQGVVNAFPGDMLIMRSDGEVYPCDPEVFAERWNLVDEAYIISDEVDEPPAPSPLPTGENPDAVNLEPDLSELAPETDEFDDQQAVDESVDDEEEDEDDEEDDALDDDEGEEEDGADTV